MAAYSLMPRRLRQVSILPGEVDSVDGTPRAHKLP
jgi:hypothetical protein